MPRPRKALEFSIAAAVITGFIFAGVLFTLPAGSITPARMTALIFSGAFFAFALMGLQTSRKDFEKFHAIRRGIGVISRWTVTADEWQSFLRNEKVLRKKNFALLNSVECQRLPANQPIEIVISPIALLVGDDFHVLGETGMIAPRPVLTATDPVAVEILVRSQNPYAEDPQEYVLRFPASRSQMHEAVKAAEAFARA